MDMSDTAAAQAARRWAIAYIAAHKLGRLACAAAASRGTQYIARVSAAPGTYVRGSLHVLRHVLVSAATGDVLSVWAQGAGRLLGEDLSGLTIEGATLHNVLLSGCDLRRTVVRGGTLQGAAVEGCDMRDAELLDDVRGIPMVLEGHTGAVSAVAMSADGRHIVSGS